ncbi:hypothetical protein EVAR_18432_1 [Eumeta japonica]|uniref:Uncharacterized protein n=1 Tax=Eumeta variegata TaxID=151549 RepID=A0A4C1UVD9_EUMVA|nr:hypothetical protein EVAR_18432_1 [Eumeta japonica]
MDQKVLGKLVNDQQITSLTPFVGVYVKLPILEVVIAMTGQRGGLKFQTSQSQLSSKRLRKAGVVPFLNLYRTPFKEALGTLNVLFDNGSLLVSRASSILPRISKAEVGLEGSPSSVGRGGSRSFIEEQCPYAHTHPEGPALFIRDSFSRVQECVECQSEDEWRNSDVRERFGDER